MKRSRSRNSPSFAAQDLRHLSPLQSDSGTRGGAPSRFPLQSRSSPAPAPHARNAHPRAGSAGHCPRMVNKFNLGVRGAGMNGRLSAVNRSNRSFRGRIPGEFRMLCDATSPMRRIRANLSRRLAPAAFVLRNGGGPRRPNAARALCEESDFVEPSCRWRILRQPKPNTPPARPYFSSGPCAKPPGWSLQAFAHRHARPFASRRARQGAARAKRSSGRMPCSGFPPITGWASSPHPTPARWRWRSGRCWGRGR